MSMSMNGNGTGNGAATRTGPVDLEVIVRDVRSRVGSALSDEQERRDRVGDGALTGDDERQWAVNAIWGTLDSVTRERLAAGVAPLDADSETRIVGMVLSRLFEADRLQPYLQRPDVTDIRIEGNEPVWLSLTNGEEVRGDPVVDHDDELPELVRELSRRSGNERRWDQNAPKIDEQLVDGSRLSGIGWVCDRPNVFIRRHHLVDVDLDDLVANGSMTQLCASFLTAAVRARLNMVIGGGLGAGKTTLLRACASAIDPTERICTIETGYELAFDQLPKRHSDVLALQAREPNIEGEGEVTCTKLVEWTKKTNAKRVIVGEVVGAEAYAMLDAMSSGSAGSMCTVHANGSAEAMDRLANLTVKGNPGMTFTQAYRLLSLAVRLSVHMTRYPIGGSRRVVSSISEVVNWGEAWAETNELFSLGPDGMAHPTGVALSVDTSERLRTAGFHDQWLQRGQL